MKNLFLIFILLFALALSNKISSQNTVITDDESYVTDTSAVLDVQSTSKGILIPRMRTYQREGITNAAKGLLVFDLDFNSFFFHTGEMWMNLSAQEDTLWTLNPYGVSLHNPLLNVGVGSTQPMAKLEVKGNAGSSETGALFNVVNADNDTIFAVYPSGVRINIPEPDPTKVGGNTRGGFAVGGLSPVKTPTHDFLVVNQDSVRIYIEEEASKIGGNTRGGFAVGGFSPNKTTAMDLLNVTSDSTRIYVNDSTAGFAVASTEGGSTGNFMDLNTQNYFIGHQAGANTTTGAYNIFLGYESGLINQIGNFNTFLGYKAGLQNTGSDNTFIGYKAGSSHLSKGGNVYLGSKAGENATNGEQNVFIGESAGSETTNGKQNVFIGQLAGFSNQGGDNNVYMGTESAYENLNGYNNVVIGKEALRNNTGGNNSIFMGYRAGFNSNGGYNNVVIGKEAGQNISGGNDNILVGNFAGDSISSGDYNIAIGTGAGRQIKTGRYNTFTGYLAGSKIHEGEYNACYGYMAGQMSTQFADDYEVIPEPADEINYQTCFGYAAGKSSQNGKNTYIGGECGYFNFNGTRNTHLGKGAGRDGQGSENIFIGYHSGYSQSGTGNIFIGNYTGHTSFEELSNLLVIDNEATSAPLIYGNFATNTLNINGDFDVAGDINITGSNSFQLNGTPIVSSQWVNNSTDIYYNSGAVGIGTSSPDYKLEVIDNTSTSFIPAIKGINTTTGGMGYGVLGEAEYLGIMGEATKTENVAYAAYFRATGSGTGTRYGVYARASGGETNYAGYFSGNVKVIGEIEKSGGTFKIDHPQDPENKYLVHSFVESPERKNIYDGVIVLDDEGKAVVEMPGYFEALNMEFRYQLTCIGGYSQVYVESEIENGTFVIAGGTPGLKVSWQVTGVRKDPYALENPIIVEEEKNPSERGLYIHPGLYGQPVEKAIDKNLEIE